MTSITSWAAVDSRGVSSLYIASDSRISWGTGQSWDQGRKTFACRQLPHIFGYWGDVLFPAMAIPLVIDRLEHQLLSVNPNRHFGAIGSTIRRLWIDYPDAQRRDAGILVGHRNGEGMRSIFSLAVFIYDAASDSWSRRSIEMPSRSGELRIAGSGASYVRNAKKLWDLSAEGGTSRAVYSAFCEALMSGGDTASGGGPQLVGLFREGPGRVFGTVYGGQRFFAGSRLTRDEAASGNVDWFNHLFERVDERTMRRLPGARTHRPRDLAHPKAYQTAEGAGR